MPLNKILKYKNKSSASSSASSLEKVTTPGPATRLIELDKEYKTHEVLIRSLKEQKQDLEKSIQKLQEKEKALQERESKVKNNAQDIHSQLEVTKQELLDSTSEDLTKQLKKKEKELEAQKQKLIDEYGKAVKELAKQEQNPVTNTQELNNIQNQLEENQNKLDNINQQLKESQNKLEDINRQKDECNMEINDRNQGKEQDSSIASTSDSTEQERIDEEQVETFDPSILQENYVENDNILSREQAEQALNQAAEGFPRVLVGHKSGDGNPLNFPELQQAIELSLRQRKSNDNNSPSTNQNKAATSENSQQPDSTSDHNDSQAKLVESSSCIPSWVPKAVGGIVGGTGLSYLIYTGYDYFTSNNKDESINTDKSSSTSNTAEDSNADSSPSVIGKIPDMPEVLA
ncbi:hypothetical protein NOVO_05830 [Rickettsiales bacterium Ac37b]|nr:hypothetical protein NOVO_05830 [Rickettsiales bacterium Ac37b]